MKIDEFQNKVNFLLILSKIVNHNIVYIFKLVNYKKKRKICLSIFLLFNLLLLSQTLKGDRKK